MSTNLENVLTAIEALTPAERQEVIDYLLDDDEGEWQPQPFVLSEEWKAELARRSAEYDAGDVKGVPWEEIQARWAAERAAGKR